MCYNFILQVEVMINMLKCKVNIMVTQNICMKSNYMVYIKTNKVNFVLNLL